MMTILTKRFAVDVGNSSRLIRILVFSLLLVGLAWSGTIGGRVTDAETGEVIAATVTIRTGAGSILTDHPSYSGGFRCHGTFEKEVPSGETTVTVRRGFDCLPLERRFTLKDGERRSETFVLRRHS